MQVGSVEKDVRLRLATLDDAWAVVRLQLRFGMNVPKDRAGAAALWDHLWGANPANLIGCALPPLGFVLESRGEVVGFFGSLPRVYSVQGRIRVAAVATSWVVHEDFRSHTKRLAGAFFGQREPDLLLVTTAVEAVGRAFIKAGGGAVPDPGLASIHFWALRPASVVRGILEERGFPRTLSHMVGSLLGTYMRAEAGIRRRQPSVAIQGVETRVGGIEAVDGRFDDLWARLSEDETRAMALRRAVDIRWVIGTPARDHEPVVITCQRDGTMTGYLLIRPRLAFGGAEVVGQIVDAMVPGDDPGLLGVLISRAYDVAMSEKWSLLEIRGFPPRMREVFASERPYVKRRRSSPYFYLAGDGEGLSHLDRAASWYVTHFDGDSSLY